MKKKELVELLTKALKERLSGDWEKMKRDDARQDAYEASQAEKGEDEEEEELRKQMQRLSNNEKTYSHLGKKPDWLVEAGEGADQAFYLKQLYKKYTSEKYKQKIDPLVLQDLEYLIDMLS
jgi:hypothetical protein